MKKINAAAAKSGSARDAAERLTRQSSHQKRQVVNVRQKYPRRVKAG